MTQEIILNHLTVREWGKFKSESPQNDWDHYKEIVILMFQIKSFYFFEKELLSKYKVDNMEALLSSYPDKFFSAGLKNIHLKDIPDFIKGEEIEKIREERGGFKESDFERAWYDIWLERFEITPEEPYYDEFFVYQLRNLDLLEVDGFLNYQLETYFENNVRDFKRFVSLSIRKHGGRLMLPDQIRTVDESLVELRDIKSEPKHEPELSGMETASKKKTKITRSQADGITILNLVQTAYLSNILRETKVLIKDDKILPTSWAGEAFETLTGYSADALRMRMNLKGQSEVTYTDRKAVREALYTAINLISKEIDEQKGSKS